MAAKQVILFGMIVVSCLCSITEARSDSGSDELISPYNAQTLRDIAYELYSSPEANQQKIKQAMALLSAAMNLDSRGEYVIEDMLRVIPKSEDVADGRLVKWLLGKYVSDKSDMEVTRDVIQKSLSDMDTREQREQLLGDLARSLQKKNKYLRSEFYTQLGFLMMEKADYDSAGNFLLQAYDDNPYNDLAFARLGEVVRQLDQDLDYHVYARHFRLMMGSDPFDLNAALTFAGYTERLELYSVAAGIYGYCADLHSYLYPDEKLPASIYLPWAITNYNTKRNQTECLKIARIVRQSGRFDLAMEAIAGKASFRMGDLENKDLIQAGIDAEKMLAGNSGSAAVRPEQVAWFYSFALDDKDKSLAWANRAYSADPTSLSVQSIFAYTLMMDQTTELAERIALAKELVSQTYQSDQIAGLTIGLIQFADEDNTEALATLKAVVAMDPSSLVAEKAINLLQQNGSEYISPIAEESIMTSLRSEFGERLVPEFKPVNEVLSVKLDVSESELFYGRQLKADLVFANKSEETLVIGESGMLLGDIRIDAEIRGDIKARLPALCVKRIGLSTPIPGGQYASVPVELYTGALKKILLTYPQASVEIEFIAYIDPVIAKNGRVANGVYGLEPIRAFVQRDGVALTREYLLQRFDAISNGQMKQKVRAIQFFAGMLAEQYAAQNTDLKYRRASVDNSLLKDALRRGLADDDWSVRTQTMASMLSLSLPQDFTVTSVVSENLTDPNWPVRLLAVYLLSQSGQNDFNRVLDWTAEYDTNANVRNLAIALGAAVPEKADKPIESPETVEQDDEKPSGEGKSEE